MDSVRFQWPTRARENTTAVAAPGCTGSEQDQATNDGLRRNCIDSKDNHTKTETTKRRRPPTVKRRIICPPPQRSKPMPKKDRTRVNRREKLGRNTARRNAAIFHHEWEEREKSTPPWVTRLFGPTPQPENLPLTGRATRTMERYYPSRTNKYSTKPPTIPYPITILNIAIHILPEVQRELHAHHHWLQHDVASTLRRNIETYLSNHPYYTNWIKPSLTKEYLRLVTEHLQTFAKYASPRLERIKLQIPGEPAAPATLTSTAIALVAMRSYIGSDASEEARRTKIVEIQRLGISNHRAHVKAYMQLWSDRVAELRAAMRPVERERVV